MTVELDAIVSTSALGRMRRRAAQRAPTRCRRAGRQLADPADGPAEVRLLRRGHDAGHRQGRRYRYYKCNTRIGQGIVRSALLAGHSDGEARCNGPAGPRRQVFTPKRVRAMLADLRAKIKTGRSDEAEQRVS